jgi:uncharacterized protein (TIGR03435 family)
VTRATVVIALTIAASATGLRAQDGPPPALRFEVASVKPNRAGDRPPRNLALIPDGVRVTNLPLSTVLWMTHRVQADQIVEVPSWARTESFDITGKAPAGVAITPESMGVMMRDLLAERFQLKTRREMREMPVFELVQLKPGSLGPRMSQAAMDCSSVASSDRPPAPPSPDAPPQCGGTARAGGVSVRGLPLSAFTRLVGPMAGRIVVDRTGLAGPWNVELEFSAEQGGGPISGAPLAAATPATDAPSLFTAVQEQLGLKLESTRARVEVIVIERLERPSPD